MPKRNKTKKGQQKKEKNLETQESLTSSLLSNTKTEGLDTVSDVNETTELQISLEEPAKKKLKIENVDSNGENKSDAEVCENNSKLNSETENKADHQQNYSEDALESEDEDDDMASEGSDEEDYLDVDEIDALLDEGMVDYKKKKNGDKSEPIVKEKVVLVEKTKYPFELLPEGWVNVGHNSGMPVYLHKESRVCTLSRPYFLGPGSARKHEIPLGAIPCLDYRQALDKEKNEQEEKRTEKGEVNEEKSDCDKLPQNVEIKQAGQEVSLTPEDVHKYCENLFQFKTITYKRYGTWKERRLEQRKEKRQSKSRPTMPANTKVITCTIPPAIGDKPVGRNREMVLNPDGKSPVCLLHEYIQKVLKLQPKYNYTNTDNSQLPYCASVLINNMEYGTGMGANKKAAKLEAAKNALAVLIPETRNLNESAKPEETDLSFFDEVKIEDPRVKDLCDRAGLSGPYVLLQECLRRNRGIGDTEVNTDMKTLQNQKCEYTIKVGKHTASVICKNKKEGRQQAAQAMLQLLHPYLTSWGSILKLYAKSTDQIQKEKKEEDSSDLTCDQSIEVDMDEIEDPNVLQNTNDASAQTEISTNSTQSLDAANQTGSSAQVLQITRVIKHSIAPVIMKEASTEMMVILQDRCTMVSEDADFLGDCWCVSSQMKIHKVTQTDWVGYQYFHKATQEPEYTSVVKTAKGLNYSTVSHLGMEDKITETDWTGNDMFHKATQFPDVNYSAEDNEKGHVTTTCSSSPAWQQIPTFPVPQTPVSQVATFQVPPGVPSYRTPQRYQLPQYQMMQSAPPYGMMSPMAAASPGFYTNYPYYPGAPLATPTYPAVSEYNSNQPYDCNASMYNQQT